MRSEVRIARLITEIDDQQQATADLILEFVPTSDAETITEKYKDTVMMLMKSLFEATRVPEGLNMTDALYVASEVYAKTLHTIQSTMIDSLAGSNDVKIAIHDGFEDMQPERMELDKDKLLN